MLDTWNFLSLSIGDVLLGWSLRLPRHMALVVIALLTSLLMILIRLVTTNQDRLRRAAGDVRQLKQLARQAKSEKDKGALRRIKATRSLITLVKLKAEGWPLLVSLVPVALLATWAVFRLEYLPVRAGETVELAVYTPVADAGELVHVVPVEHVVADSGWVRQVRAVADGGPAHGLATWTLRAEQANSYGLIVRLKEHSFPHELVVGRRTYALPVVDHGNEYITEWKRPPYQWLGVVPGIDAAGLPPWLIAYLILAIPLTLVLKRAMDVY